MQNTHYKILLVLFISGSAYAQTPHELDNIYTPDGNSIFKSDGKSIDTYAEVRQTVKFNPTLLPRGVFALHYERKLSEEISILAGLGKNFGKDLCSFIGPRFYNNSTAGSSVSLTEILSKGMPSAGLNLFTSLSGKFYPGSSVFEGRYIEFGIRYSLFNMGFPNADEYPNVYGEPTRIRIVSYNFMYGGQICTDERIKTTHDFYWGAGIQKIRYNTFEFENVPGLNKSYNVVTDNWDSGLSVMIILGYAFGIGF